MILDLLYHVKDITFIWWTVLQKYKFYVMIKLIVIWLNYDVHSKRGMNISFFYNHYSMFVIVFVICKMLL